MKRRLNTVTRVPSAIYNWLSNDLGACDKRTAKYKFAKDAKKAWAKASPRDRRYVYQAVRAQIGIDIRRTQGSTARDAFLLRVPRWEVGGKQPKNALAVVLYAYLKRSLEL